jgi:hypothetical protein
MAPNDRFCSFCLNPKSILLPETCCTGCTALKLKDKTKKRGLNFLKVSAKLQNSEHENKSSCSEMGM